MMVLTHRIPELVIFLMERYVARSRQPHFRLAIRLTGEHALTRMPKIMIALAAQGTGRSTQVWSGWSGLTYLISTVTMMDSGANRLGRKNAHPRGKKTCKYKRSSVYFVLRN